MRTYFLIILLLLTFSSIAQVPHGINYQAVIRNTNGSTVNNTSVGIRMNILQGGPSGTIVYSESFAAITSNIGLVNFVIGQGQVISGNFSSINWGSGSFFLEIAVDETGGTNYAVIGVQQMMSVPYALYAENSGNPGPQGPAGANGNDGQDGVSAYQTWLSLGNTGTEADFIASLTGPQGAQGAQGPQATPVTELTQQLITEMVR